MTISLAEILGKEKLEKTIKFFSYLYERWRDEKKYEDFAEYKTAMEKNLECKILKMTKRPFKVIFIPKEGFKAELLIKGRNILWFAEKI